MTPGYYSENPFIVNTIAQAPIATVHFHSGYSEFGYSEKSLIMNAVSGPPVHHSVAFTCVIVNFLFNAYPRAATAAKDKLAVLSLSIIDACGKLYWYS